MAINKFIYKSYQNKISFLKQEIQKLSLKTLIASVSVSKTKKILFSYKLSKLSRKGSASKLLNICLFTGRSKGISRKFGMSKKSIKYFLLRGDLLYFKKSSW